MGRIGFWQLLLDDKVSYWEAQKINDAHDAAEVAQQYAVDAQNTASSLGRRIEMMSREIIMLRTALTVLTQTLKDAKAIDERVLDARLEAAMEEAFPKPPPYVPPTPAGDIPITCLRCRQKVPAGTTIMTGDGPICERPCTP